VDYVFWTEEVQRGLEKVNSDLKTFPVSGKELWISGKVDQKVREMFTKTGWKIQENANDILFKKKK
jgi:hypothetical protein